MASADGRVCSTGNRRPLTSQFISTFSGAFVRRCSTAQFFDADERLLNSEAAGGNGSVVVQIVSSDTRNVQPQGQGAIRQAHPERHIGWRLTHCSNNES